MTYQSRLNAFRLNTSYLGLYVPELYLSVGGTDRTSVLNKATFKIDYHAQRPYEFRFDVRGVELTPGHEVVVRDGGSNGKILFAGHILPRAMRFRNRKSVIYDQCVAQDYSWFMDRFALVTREYFSMSANGMVNDIITNFTDGGILPGNIDSSLGALSMTFTNETVSRALRRIAAAIGGILVVRPNKHIDIVTSVVDGHAITINDAATDYWDFSYGEDLSQVRTRTIIEGRGSALAADVGFGVGTLTLESTGWAPVGGGTARLNTSVFTYTGKTATTLTGVSGLTTDGAIGDSVNLQVTANNAAAQATMAALLGGGASGIVTHYIQDRRLSEDEATKRAAEDVASFGLAIPTLFYRTRDRFVTPFKTVTVSLTNPRTISPTLAIDTVSIRMGRKKFAQGTQTNFEYGVTATPLAVTLPELLGHVTFAQEQEPVQRGG